MSDSVQSHRLQPTRLPHPWDSPGKNTGVGCHFLLQCMKVKSESEVAQSCPTLSDPMDCSLPASSIHRIFQARVLEWGAIVFSILTTYFLAYLIIILTSDYLCKERSQVIFFLLLPIFCKVRIFCKQVVLFLETIKPIFIVKLHIWTTWFQYGKNVYIQV